MECWFVIWTQKKDEFYYILRHRNLLKLYLLHLFSPSTIVSFFFSPPPFRLQLHNLFFVKNKNETKQLLLLCHRFFFCRINSKSKRKIEHSQFAVFFTKFFQLFFLFFSIILFFFFHYIVFFNSLHRFASFLQRHRKS